MATFTTTLLGSLSRIFFVPSSARPGIPSARSVPDLASDAASLVPACSPNARQRHRPYSVTEGYWGWADGPRSGMILRRSTGERDSGLKYLPDTTITQTSPVLISCRPPHGPALCEFSPAASSPPADTDTAEGRDLPLAPADITPTSDVDVPAESSFDISLISDTSTAISDELESEADSYELDDLAAAHLSSPQALPAAPVPAPAVPFIGLGITGLFKSDGSPFDGMGVVSFGCAQDGYTPAAVTEGGLSRTFLEETLLTWAADPQHLMARVISPVQDDAALVAAAPVLAPETAPLKTGPNSKSTTTRRTTASQKQNRPPTRATTTASASSVSTAIHRRSNLKLKTRDLSAATTISSELKRRGAGTGIASSTTEVVRQRSASVVPGARRTTGTASMTGVWRS